MRKFIIDLIVKIVKQPNAFDVLAESLEQITRKRLSENIIECGILPEMFAHDSSEEKLWAKYSDIVLSLSLNFLNISSEVLRTRGDSADVFGKTADYSIVGDAKTFRLSRTAKNQKDFKVKALDDWRREDTYAVLVAPLSQYPNRKSQIYSQAIERNITLLSYVHLSFLLNFHNKQDLKPLWEIGRRLKEGLNPSRYQSSQFYWDEVDEVICHIVDRNLVDLKQYKQIEIEKTQEIGNEGIVYWKNRIKGYNRLSKKEAIRELIRAEKIDTKIKTIQKTINQRFAI